MKKILIILAIFIVGIFSFFRLQDKKNKEIIVLSERASYLNTTQKLTREAAGKLERMIAAAEKDGMCLVVLSGYRTLERQQKIWDEAEDKSIVARPGTSEHEKGIAVDLGGCPMKDGKRDDNAERLELKKDFDHLPEYRWLLEHAWEFDFIQSYTAKNKNETGLPAEPWHWRFEK